MKYYYSIVTSFHGSKSVARFTSKQDRDTFVREFGVPVIDPNMGACWDTGRSSAEAVAASDSRVRYAVREDFWTDEEFNVRTYEGDVTGTISYDAGI